MSQVGHEFRAQVDVHAGDGGQALGDFRGAVGEPGAESVGVDDGVGSEALLTAQLVEVLDGQFQDVGLLELGDVLTLGLEGGYHELLELVQTVVDASATLAFQHWFHNL